MEWQSLYRYLYLGSHQTDAICCIKITDCIKKSQPQLWDVISCAYAGSSRGYYLERRILINVSVLDFLLSLVPVSSMSRINGYGVTCVYLFGCLPSLI